MVEEEATYMSVSFTFTEDRSGKGLGVDGWTAEYMMYAAVTAGAQAPRETVSPRTSLMNLTHNTHDPFLTYPLPYSPRYTSSYSIIRYPKGSSYSQILYNK